MKKETITNYHSNGNRSSETPFVNGKIHGLQIWGHSNGNRWDEIPFKNSLEHGSKIYFIY